MQFTQAIIAFLILSFSTMSMAMPKIGEAAPDFKAVDSKGNSHNLSQFKGKFVVLEWTNHDCPFVVKHYSTQNMQNLQKAYTEKDVVWLSVISSAEGQQGHVDGKTADELTASRQAAPTAVLLDPSGEIGKLYDAKTTPHMYIIDKEGKLVYMGAIDDKPNANKADVAGANNYVKAALDELLAGKPVTMASTRAYGCSVKY